MSEWIDPQYADLAAAWQRAQHPQSRDPQRQPEPQPRRAFIVPSKG